MNIKNRNKVRASHRPKRVIANAEVSEEAAELLFEAEDVADLIAEVTGETVTVESDGTTATFEVGEEAFTVEAEESDEVVESSTRIVRGKRPVKASRALAGKRNGRSMRKMPRRK